MGGFLCFHGFHRVFNFVIGDPLKRLSLCIFWMLVICASILCFYKISKDDKTERILLRKYYHLVAVLMFIPALAFQTEFLDLAFSAALAVFLTLEIIRAGLENLAIGASCASVHECFYRSSHPWSATSMESSDGAKLAIKAGDAAKARKKK
ncbi:hypothetical protein QJS10_CPA16g00486 [Acorus calamus]|uniref:dolichol kinase n=1 Tax=Acorus calamus TaxID=4465 RepID=A0AAV9D2L4_ACOCL|nr:hypothetical protein QJS10_CPA16g00486 [Acorus calamus]